MKKDFLTELGVDPEIAPLIMEENGRDIQNARRGSEELKAELERQRAESEEYRLESEAKLKSAARDFDILLRLDRETFSSRPARDGVLAKLRALDDGADIDAALDSIKKSDAEAFASAAGQQEQKIELSIPAAGGIAGRQASAVRAAFGLM